MIECDRMNFKMTIHPQTGNLQIELVIHYTLYKLIQIQKSHLNVK